MHRLTLTRSALAAMHLPQSRLLHRPHGRDGVPARRAGDRRNAALARGPHHRRHASSLFFAIALLWACIGSVDIIATAQGKIVPTGRTKVIQPLESGVVHAIHVQDGQKVKAGDVLIEIDTTISASERDRLKNDYMQAMLDTARLKAALDLDGDPARDVRRRPKAPRDTQVALQKTLLTNQVDEIRAKLSDLDHQIAQNTGNRDAVTSTITKLTESIPYLEETRRGAQIPAR